MTARKNDFLSAFTDFFFYQNFCAIPDQTQIGEDDFFSAFLNFWDLTGFAI